MTQARGDDEPTLSPRAAILAAGRSWAGTPFHDGARLKGVGVDCAQFIAAIFVESGVLGPFEVPVYSPQWFMHRDEERLVDFVLRHGHEIEEASAREGDLVLYKLGRAFAHAALIVSWRKGAPQDCRILHAHKLSGTVLEMRAFDCDLKGHPTRFFSLWP